MIKYPKEKGIKVMSKEKTKYQKYMNDLSEAKFKCPIGIKKHTAQRCV